MRAFIILAVFLLLIQPLTPARLNAQGCSDAGFCTLHALKPSGEDAAGDIRENSIAAGASYGKADFGIAAYAGFIEYARMAGASMTLIAKITAASLSGDPASVAGLSDLFVNADYRASADVNIVAGIKVPLNDANRTLDGNALPMDYQTSLGTLDLIAGAGYRWNRFQLFAAFQQPLSQNGNTFLAPDPSTGSPFAGFYSTNGYERKGDVLVRLTGGFPVGEQWTFTAGLLPIYHLGDDSFADAAGVRRDIAGSRGLTLNGNLFAQFSIDARNSLELTIGAPFVTRDARPDGLTRSVVAALEYRAAF